MQKRVSASRKCFSSQAPNKRCQVPLGRARSKQGGGIPKCKELKLMSRLAYSTEVRTMDSRPQRMPPAWLAWVPVAPLRAVPDSVVPVPEHHSSHPQLHCCYRSCRVYPNLLISVHDHQSSQLDRLVRGAYRGSRWGIWTGISCTP